MRSPTRSAWSARGAEPDGSSSRPLRPAARERPHPLPELLGPERLPEVVRAAHLHRRDLVAEPGASREEEDRHVARPRLALEDVAELPSRHPGHVDVEDEDVGRLAEDGMNDNQKPPENAIAFSDLALAMNVDEDTLLQRLAAILIKRDTAAAQAMAERMTDNSEVMEP